MLATLESALCPAQEPIFQLWLSIRKAVQYWLGHSAQVVDNLKMEQYLSQKMAKTTIREADRLVAQQLEGGLLKR